MTSNGNKPGKPHKPHDSTFRSAMSFVETAKGLLKQHLPQDIQAVLDFNTIEPTGESFVEVRMKHLYTDVLFRVKLKDLKDKPAYIYTLVEHQSQSDPLMPLRILRYTLAAMNYHARHYKTRDLPLIYPW